MKILSILYKSVPRSIWKIGSNIYHSYLKYKYLKGKRPITSEETSKAKARRIKENFFENYTKGKGLAI